MSHSKHAFTIVLSALVGLSIVSSAFAQTGAKKFGRSKFRLTPGHAAKATPGTGGFVRPSRPSTKATPGTGRHGFIDPYVPVGPGSVTPGYTVPQPTYITPQRPRVTRRNYVLPRLGVTCHTHAAYGLHITWVHWGSLAEQMGLENGDYILAANGTPLVHDGSWYQAVQQALYNQGGYLRLRIRDVRTHRVVYRDCRLF